MPGLALLVLYCADPDACRDFSTALGCAFTRERHGDGPPHWAAELDGGTVLELYPATARRPVSSTRVGLRTALAPGRVPVRRVLTDPDGRAVEVAAGG